MNRRLSAIALTCFLALAGLAGCETGQKLDDGSAASGAPGRRASAEPVQPLPFDDIIQPNDRILFIGDDIGAGHESPEAVAQCLDRAIMERLQLFPVNYDAARRVAAMDPGSDFATLDLPPASDSPLDERLAGCADDAAPYLLRMYANPVLQRHRLGLPIVQ